MLRCKTLVNYVLISTQCENFEVLLFCISFTYWASVFCFSFVIRWEIRKGELTNDKHSLEKACKISLTILPWDLSCMYKELKDKKDQAKFTYCITFLGKSPQNYVQQFKRLNSTEKSLHDQLQHVQFWVFGVIKILWKSSFYFNPCHNAKVKMKHNI